MQSMAAFGNRFVAMLSSLGLLVLVLGGCATIAPAPAPTPPPVELVSAGPLELPASCEPARGGVYRTSFVVQVDGSVAEVRSASGDGCVQQALQQWVSSFRYQPVEAAVPLVIDWIQVSASRGG